jgi:hypothetical protein
LRKLYPKLTTRPEGKCRSRFFVAEDRIYAPDGALSQPATSGPMREHPQFLAIRKYISEKDRFGKEEYWQPPEEFEQRKKGDCEDFAFWRWRQLFEMGCDVRLVCGRHGRFVTGHA